MHAAQKLTAMVVQIGSDKGHSAFLTRHNAGLPNREFGRPGNRVGSVKLL